jgi:response regulator NasT
LLLFPRVKPRWRVLVVDDHRPSVRALTEAVTGSGGEVVGACGLAREALARVAELRPDVAVCAVGLPDQDGVEVARRIVNEARCPVVLLTSRCDQSLSGRAVQAGVLGVLAKPLRPEEVPPALDVAVSRHRELEDARRENDALKRAIESRKVVERAKGLLMDRLGVTEAEAFHRIRKTAMNSRRPMADVARALLLAEDVGTPLPH